MSLEYKKITSISKITKKSTVVNFSVQKNENYFANGILTHNCYCKRHVNDGVKIAENIDDILNAITTHYHRYRISPWYKENKPNQTDPNFITYDIGCNEDLALHAKWYDMQKIIFTAGQHLLLKMSFATKYVNYDLPSIKGDALGQIRIRFSLMPQVYSSILEPNTSLIIDRIKAIDKFIEKGYEVHINFSPVIVTDTWLEDYRDLFLLVDEHVSDENKNKVLAEVIFLTHNEKKHEYNIKHNLPGENLLWRPELQENKISQYGGENIRYQHQLKQEYITQFIGLHDLIIPWNKIRYIF